MLSSVLPTDAQQICLLELAKYYEKSLEFRPSQTDFEFQVSPLCVRFLLSCDLSPWNLNKESKAQLYWVGDGDIIIKETNYVYKQVKPPGPGSGEVPAGDGPMFV